MKPEPSSGNNGVNWEFLKGGIKARAVKENRTAQFTYEEAKKEKKYDSLLSLKRKFARQIVLTATERQLKYQVNMIKSTIMSSIGSMATALTTYSKYSTNKGTKNMGEN